MSERQQKKNTDQDSKANMGHFWPQSNEQETACERMWVTLVWLETLIGSHYESGCESSHFIGGHIMKKD